jgi:hypothetical protein
MNRHVVDRAGARQSRAPEMALCVRVLTPKTSESGNCVRTVQGGLKAGDEYRHLRRHIKEHPKGVTR